MSANLVVTDYNLALVPQPPPDGGQQTVDPFELATILHDPVIGGEPLRAVSARTQLSLVFHAPTATVVDHNGAPPARPEMVATTIDLIEMFDAQGFSVPWYSWNIEGMLTGVDVRNAMSRLTDTRQLTDMLGDPSDAWTVLQLTLSVDAGSVGAEHINVTLQVDVELDGQESLRFDANAHYARAPDISQLRDEGVRVWATISEVIRRLTS